MAQTALKHVIECLSEVFDKYAKEDEDVHTLSKAEAKKLLETELPELLKNPGGSEKVKQMVEDLDLDQDGKIDFLEFSIMTMTLSIAHKLCS
ncbi:protein S100-G-like [Salarias fasciatus]|uniref:protein S100-G-like n=1 Tax=Salarias fasciatus TaxID=181472 RepID=UPI00117665BF|nr:protein S100-G-like [Salarias fasciatus]